MKTLTYNQIKKQKLEGYFWIQYQHSSLWRLAKIFTDRDDIRIISCETFINKRFNFDYKDYIFVKVDEPVI